jgi:hypothetical protein
LPKQRRIFVMSLATSAYPTRPKSKRRDAGAALQAGRARLARTSSRRCGRC